MNVAADEQLRLKPSNREETLPCLGVVVPAFNEGATIREALSRVLAQACVAEVIVVEDGSKDDTAVEVKAVSAKDKRVVLVQHSENQGKGAAIRTGLARITASIVVIQDADLEYDPGDYEKLLEPVLRGEVHVVYGSRFMRGAKPNTSFCHRLQNRLLTMATNLLTGLQLTDEATCYKMFRRELIERIHLQENGFGFCPEITVKISRRGLRILEVPISYHARSYSAGKKLRLRDGFGAVRCLLKYSLPVSPGDPRRASEGGKCKRL